MLPDAATSWGAKCSPQVFNDLEYFVGTYRILPEKGLIFLRFRVQRTEKRIPTVTIDNSSHALYDIELDWDRGKVEGFRSSTSPAREVAVQRAVL